MSGLIDRLISKYCPEGVKYRKLDSGTDERLVKIETGKLDANAAVENGKYMFFTTARQASRIDSYNWDCEALIVAGNANIGDMKHYKGKFNAYQRTYILTNFHRDISPRFLYFVMLNNLKQYLNANKNVGAMTYIVLSTLQNFTIPVPPLPVQKEIVRILDKFSELESELESELKLRKKQFEYYRNKMLTKDYLEQCCPEGVEYKFLWEITSWDKRFKEVDNSKQAKIDKYHYYFAAELDDIIDKTGDIKILTTSKTDLYTTKELASNNVVNAEIVCIPGGGNPVVQYYNGEFVTGDNRIARVLDINELDTKYLYYAMNIQLKTIASFYRGAGIKHPNMASVLDLKIPIPPLPVQKEIVRILDKFSTLTNSISEGLPAEIKLGHRRYEYYRDELFKFEKLESETA